MHLILTGATGLVGSGVLHNMLNAPSISKISILSRRPVPQAEGHAKANVIIHKDYNTYTNEVLAQLKGAEGVVWAQGVSQTQVSREEYFKITYDYPIAAAKAFTPLASPNPFKFIYVSGEGATTTPGMFTQHFGVIKGRTEAALLALSKDPEYALLRPFSVRPGGVDPAQHEEIKEWIPKRNFMFRVMDTTLLPVLRKVGNGLLSPTRELGVFLTELAGGDGEALEGRGVEAEGRTVTNAGFRRLSGLAGVEREL